MFKVTKNSRQKTHRERIEKIKNSHLFPGAPGKKLTKLTFRRSFGNIWSIQFPLLFIEEKLFLTTLIYGLFAVACILSKQSLKFSSPPFLVGVRMGFTGLFLLFFLFLRRKKLTPPLSKGDGWILFAVAFFNIYLANVWEFVGMRDLSTAKVSSIYTLTPFISALFSYIFLREKLTRKKCLAIGMAFSGLLLICLEQHPQILNEVKKDFLSTQEIYLFFAVISTSLGWILVRYLVSIQGHCPWIVNAWSMLGGGLLSLCHSLWVDFWNPFPIIQNRYGACFLLIFCTALLANLICYNLYAHLLRHFSATFLSLIGSVCPLFTALLGWIFLEERVHWPFWASFFFILPSLFLFHIEEIKQNGLKDEKQEA